ncbi:MAG: hypothetical protein ACYDD0_08735, partial [Candidatus Dormibacteria bacterium]
KSGGYYCCLAATKGACDNHLLVRRTLAERVIIEAVRERLADAGTIRLKEAELQADERRLANFVDFI